MNILAFDTSGPTLSVALMQNGILRFSCTQQNGLTHSDSLMPLIDMAFQTAGLKPLDIDCFAVTNGPGSFTGVRIGVSTAKALAHATDKPCMAVSALEALAKGASLFGGTVCALQDARAGQVYCAAYRGDTRIIGDVADKLEIVLQELKGKGRCCFTGDGAVAHRGVIAAALDGEAFFAPPEASYVQASVVARIAAQRPEEWNTWTALNPYYLRAPQAERERKAREGK